MIKLDFLKNKIVGIVGLGKTGLATMEALKLSNITYKTYDDNTKKDDNFLTGLDIIVWSPGVDVNLHKMAKEARKKNIEIISDIELLYRACPKATYIAITGTNGKSTTASLMADILKTNGVPCELGGNIGNPALSLKALDENGIYVLELSSYQIELIKDMKFRAGGILNLAPDHLERHETMENYANIKKTMLESCDIKLISIDDEYTKNIADSFEDKITVSVNDKDANINTSSGMLKEFDLPIMQVNNIPALKGEHNQQNIAFAYGLLRNSTKLTPHDIEVGILRFQGLKHRQQQLGMINGVLFINDSKATNPEATEPALKSFENIHWIVGGKEKSDDFSLLAKYLDKVKKAYVIGHAEEALVKFFKKEKFTNFEISKDLETATASALKNSEKGDVVLLSPACASYDQFKNFEVRGDTFIEYFKHLS